MQWIGIAFALLGLVLLLVGFAKSNRYVGRHCTFLGGLSGLCPRVPGWLQRDAQPVPINAGHARKLQ